MSADKRVAAGPVGERKRISPLELFMDLVFVGVISVIADDIDPSSDTKVLVVVVMAGMMGFLLWFCTTLVFNFFPAEHAPRDAREASWRAVRLVLIFIEMVALLLAALAVDPDGGLAYRDGFWALAVTQVMIVLLIHVGQRVSRDAPKYATVAQVLLSVAAVFSVLAAVLPYSLTLLAVLGLCGLAAQVAAALVLCVPREPLVRMWHVSERFGLLLLIAIGEAFITLGFSLRFSNEVPYPLMLVAALIFPLAMFVLYFGIAAPIRMHHPPLWLWAVLQCFLVMETVSAGHQLAAIAGEPELALLPWASSGTSIRLAELLVVTAALCWLGRRVPASVPVVYLIAAGLILAIGFSPAPSPDREQGLRIALQSIVLMLAAIAGIAFTVKRSDAVWRRDWFGQTETETE